MSAPTPRNLVSSRKEILLVLATLLLAVPSYSQQASSQEGKDTRTDQAQADAQDVLDSFDEAIDVRVVNLEVVVTDSSGARVYDLQADDFELIVDGQIQPIDYFSEVRGGASVASANTAGAPPLPGIAPEGAVGTNYLVYVDDNRTRFTQRAPIVRNLIAQLPELRPQDRMAVVAQSGTRLRMLSSWTSSHDELEQALSRLLDKSDFGGSLRSAVRTARETGITEGRGERRVRTVTDETVLTDQLLDEIESLDLNDDSRFGEFLMQEQLVDLDFAIAGVVSTLRGFARPAGRKVMLMIGGDWPLGSFRDEGVFFTDDLQLAAGMIETANLLGYTLYPVNASRSNDVWRHATLAFYAKATGGLPLHKPRDVLATVVRDTESYYWLGFSPDFQRNDVRHRVEIRAKRPGLTVRSRGSYLDMSQSAQLAMAAQGALLFDRSSSATPIELQFGEPTRNRLRKMDLPVTVLVPLDLVTMVPVQGQDVARLELRFAVVDATGAQAQIPVIPITLTGEHRQGDVFRYATSLHLRRRPHELVVSVHDPLSGKIMNARAKLSFRQGGIASQPVLASLSRD